jgi:hypothetical protein
MDLNSTAWQNPTPPSTQVDLPAANALNVSFGDPWSFDSHNLKF